MIDAPAYVDVASSEVDDVFTMSTRQLFDGDLNSYFQSSGSDLFLWITLRQPFDRIEVFNRQDCCQMRLVGAHITIIDAVQRTVFFNATFTSPYPTYTFDIPSLAPTAVSSTSGNDNGGPSGQSCAAGFIGRNGVMPCVPCPSGYYSFHTSEFCFPCFGFIDNCVENSGVLATNLTSYLQSIYSHSPTHQPSFRPTLIPTFPPSVEPSAIPTAFPSDFPTERPSLLPTMHPTAFPTDTPITPPTVRPSVLPTNRPTLEPSAPPTFAPTFSPSCHYLSGRAVIMMG